MASKPVLILDLNFVTYKKTTLLPNVVCAMEVMSVSATLID